MEGRNPRAKQASTAASEITGQHSGWRQPAGQNAFSTKIGKRPLLIHAEYLRWSQIWAAKQASIESTKNSSTYELPA
jgi:hypothetical protein